MPDRAPFRISRKIGRFTWERRLLVGFILLAMIVAGRSWLADHPQHDPWAPLDLRDPPGWATASKIAALRGDTSLCRAVLERSEVAFTALPATGDGACRRTDRTVLPGYPLSPKSPPTTCDMAIGLELWRGRLDAIAQETLGSPVQAIEHLGAYSCRRKYGRSTGGWSEHATGNAIDIAGFLLADGRRITVLGDWSGGDPEAQFLHAARDAACRAFGIVLSPDYNAAHRDHLHFDMAARPGGLCR